MFPDRVSNRARGALGAVVGAVALAMLIAVGAMLIRPRPAGGGDGDPGRSGPEAPGRGEVGHAGAFS